MPVIFVASCFQIIIIIIIIIIYSHIYSLLCKEA